MVKFLNINDVINFYAENEGDDNSCERCYKCVNCHNSNNLEGWENIDDFNPMKIIWGILEDDIGIKTDVPEAIELLRYGEYIFLGRDYDGNVLLKDKNGNIMRTFGESIQYLTERKYVTLKYDKRILKRLGKIFPKISNSYPEELRNKIGVPYQKIENINCSSLWRSYGCTNCNNCFICRNCTGCIKNTGCHNCTNCDRCERCYGSENCTNCKYICDGEGLSDIDGGNVIRHIIKHVKETGDSTPDLFDIIGKIKNNEWQSISMDFIENEYESYRGSLYLKIPNKEIGDKFSIISNLISKSPKEDDWGEECDWDDVDELAEFD